MCQWVCQAASLSDCDCCLSQPVVCSIMSSCPHVTTASHSVLVQAPRLTQWLQTSSHLYVCVGESLLQVSGRACAPVFVFVSVSTSHSQGFERREEWREKKRAAWRSGGGPCFAYPALIIHGNGVGWPMGWPVCTNHYEAATLCTQVTTCDLVCVQITRHDDVCTATSTRHLHPQ